ncbi:DNA-binding transcription factor adr1 [Sarracenia purpurea var. burkii]
MEEEERYKGSLGNLGVGMEVVKRMVKKMVIGREDSRVVGICGIGGSGKTTLARAICRDGEVRVKEVAEDEDEGNKQIKPEEDVEVAVEETEEKGSKNNEGKNSESGFAESDEDDTELNEEEEGAEDVSGSTEKEIEQGVSQPPVSLGTGNSNSFVVSDFACLLPVARNVVQNWISERMVDDRLKQVGEKGEPTDHACKVLDKLPKSSSQDSFECGVAPKVFDKMPQSVLDMTDSGNEPNDVYGVGDEYYGEYYEILVFIFKLGIACVMFLNFSSAQKCY